MFFQKFIADCGVKDLVEVKFYENRANGQSKGYAQLVFGSEASVRTVTDSFPQKKLHDQTLVILLYNKQSQIKLEEATKRVDMVGLSLRTLL
jgi:cleavage and polyadenylation specificity factor subunit 6/7